MPDLSTFREMSFVEQISLLDQIETSKDLSAIGGLLELYENPLHDDAVDQAVADTLRTLLPQSETFVLQGLDSRIPKTVKMCAQVAGSGHLSSAVEKLALLAETQDDPDVLLEVLSALAKMDGSGHPEVFRSQLSHPDPIIAAQCIETLGEYRDDSILEDLRNIIDRAEADDRFQNCDLVTSKAIDATAAIGGKEAIQYLVDKIHHRNPTARRQILESLVRFGAQTLPYLTPLFDQDDVDIKIMAANVIGFIGDKSGGDTLVMALDKGQAQHPNVRYAVYEALGHIPSLKGLICLVDGLQETDEMLLLAVVTALEPQANPGLVGRIKGILEKGDEQSHKVLRAIVMAKATQLFQLLYENEAISTALVATVIESKDADIIEAFAAQLDEIGGPRAGADAAKLRDVSVSTGQTRILAADDSKSMLMFYKAVASGMNVQLETAVNGREALDIIERGEIFNLVITDLNMPVMDGIQLTQRIRTNLFSGGVPILMVTTESEGSQVELAKEAGVTDFIQKPLTPAALGNKIQELLG